ncbi:MAG: MFS transporter [Coriobacteriales bacterium]
MASREQSKGTLYGTFAIIVLVLALSNMSQTACNSMLVAIGADYGISEDTGQWLTTAYMLVIGITVPAVAFLSKRYSNRTLLIAACGLFLAGCAIDALAPSFLTLLAGRILQALCAGIAMPLVQGYASMRFPSHLRATGMGIAGIALGFAPNVGPVLGGVFVSYGDWRMLFAVTAVLSLALLAATLIVAPHEEPGAQISLDMASLALSTLGFGGMLLGISNASTAGLTSPLLWVPLAVGTIFVLLFFLRQRRASTPLINLGIFSSRRFSSILVIQSCMMGSYLGITLILPLFIQNLWGGSSMDAGMAYIPATVLALFLNPLSGILADKLGPRPICIAGGAFLAAGSIGMVFMDAQTSMTFCVAFHTLRCAGISCLMGPTNAYALGGLGPITMDASSFLALMRQACAALGTAVMVLLIAQLNLLSAAGAIPAALPYQAAFGFSAVVATAAFLLIVVFVRNEQR